MNMQYEQPWQVDNTEGAYFYHTIELPELGVMEGDWDLRQTAKDYLGRQDFSECRCLDIGAATGFLTFYMEQQGADVVAFDQSDQHHFDLLPDWKAASFAESVAKMKRGFWLSHRLLKSKANAFYGNIYDLPIELGQFDYAVLGSILLHLENPVGAIRQAAQLADRIIISDVHRPYIETPHMVFRPSFPELRNDFLYWWYLPKETIFRILQSFGFEIEDCYLFTATGKVCGDTGYYCVVAKRR